MPSIVDRLTHAWEAFAKPDQERRLPLGGYGASFGVRPDRFRPSIASDRSIVQSIYTRIAIDAAAIDMRHVKVDRNGRYMAAMDSQLNNCLTLEANLDQAARQFRIDAILTLFDKGVMAMVPIETTLDPSKSTAYDITTMRVGEIVAWYPQHVRVLVYNARSGRKEELQMSKRDVAIVENPLYNVMNEPNSTLQRLIRKLSLIDTVDEQSSSGKLDILIQLPYVIKTEERRRQAEQRRADIEQQLKGSKYGIAYTDGTEKVTQLNRPAENNMLAQVTYLQAMLYGQLGITEGVMNGTAPEDEMTNYYNRTLEPVLTALTQEMKRKFLTKTGRTQGQSIEFYRDPFRTMSMKDFGNVADQLSRNEIATANELRAYIGMLPSTDPKADTLMNSNVTPSAASAPPAPLEGTFEPLPPEQSLEEALQDPSQWENAPRPAIAPLPPEQVERILQNGS